jgi:hypothetical protein
MSKPPDAAAANVPDRLLETESSLGQALAVIHRLLPKLESLGQEAEVQAAFKRAAVCLESARAAYQHLAESRATAAVSAKAQAGVAGETLAAISAAIAVVLGRPYRLISMAKVPVPVPHLNVWALEGRTQIFQSHKIR